MDSVLQNPEDTAHKQQLLQPEKSAHTAQWFDNPINQTIGNEKDIWYCKGWSQQKKASFKMSIGRIAFESFPK